MKDKYGNYVVVAKEPTGDVSLVLWDDSFEDEAIHVYSPKKARKLAKRLLVAADQAEA